MEISVAAQSRAMIQALGLGMGAGLLYDLFRVLRVRVPIRLLGSVLDLLFWLTMTVVLFLWSLDAWGGWIRLYGAAGLLAGGVVYFHLFSRPALKFGYFGADVITLVCRLALLPLNSTILLLKKLKKFAKNSFHYGRKWYKINQISEEMAAVSRRKAARESGGESCAHQKGWVPDQDRGTGSVDLYGNLTVGSAQPAPDKPRGRKRA